jgi:phytol kinase
MNWLFDYLDKVEVIRSLIVVLIGTFCVGNLAWKMRKRGVRDGYTRKFNHFGLSLISVMILFGLPDESFVPTSIFTSLCVLLVYFFSSLSRSEFMSSIMRSNIRDRDFPSGNFFVFLPLISGQVATYTALAVADPMCAKIAFCSMGLGDGLAEPVGIRYGRTTYRIFDPIWRTWNTKSLQGSSMVFLASIICCAAILIWSTEVKAGIALLVAAAYALAITCVEALAPRGMDNMLIISIGALFMHFAMSFL